MVGLLSPLDKEVVKQLASALQLSGEHVRIALQGDARGTELILGRLVANEFRDDLGRDAGVVEPGVPRSTNRLTCAGKACSSISSAFCRCGISRERYSATLPWSDHSSDMTDGTLFDAPARDQSACNSRSTTSTSRHFPSSRP